MQVSVNSNAASLCEQALQLQSDLRIQSHRTTAGTQIIDFGVHVSGGLEAGLWLSRICMGNAAKVQLGPVQSGSPASIYGPCVWVHSDAPVVACMAAQYAGWPVQVQDYFAMGSGPMRAKRGKEKILEHLSIEDVSPMAVGVLETEKLPDDSVCQQVAQECNVSPDRLILCVAPTRSIAGATQVVARSIETCLHKMHELGIDITRIQSATGQAPLAPPAVKTVDGIGRTNDAILYGSQVTLYVDMGDAEIFPLGPKIPSNASTDWGRPFAKIFKGYDYDFYKVDPSLFSPAVVTICNLRTGKVASFGQFRPDVLATSFLG